MCAKVQSKSRLALQCLVQGHRASSTHELCLGKHIFQGRRLPRKIFTCWVGGHCFSAIQCDEICVVIEDDKAWDALYLELLGQCRLELALSVRERQPRHFSMILIKCLLFFVARNKDNFQTLSFEAILVPLSQLGCEASAWWAPVGAKVESHCRLACQCCCCADLASRCSQQLTTQELTEGRHCSEVRNLRIRIRWPKTA
mmetsp:Transcript_26613/g.61160  ORF Transcript_26613/g.61160 Transcript_26613/m.61160 type:complete len:200 (-) Transcript_26613:7-606(-)